jgi:hypothetical protein
MKKASSEEVEEIMHPEEVKSQLQQLSMILDTRTARPPEIRQEIEEIKQKTKTKPEITPAKNTTTFNLADRFQHFKTTVTGLFKRPKAANQADLDKLAQEKALRQEAMAQIASSPARAK